ncbi:hypothetical protein KCU64_g1278, partial [Aureobasidium melanogenum]
MADELRLPFRSQKRQWLHRFNTLHPPRKPPYIPERRWSKFSSRLRAKLNDDKTGFDVKLAVFSDSTAYKLGPPSSVPDYPHHLEKYGMQVLEAAGFLNHKDEGTSGKINGRWAFEAWRNPDHSPDLQKRIHVVWRWQEWVNITPHQYSLMTPALLLASAILDDPVTLNYFYALAMPADSMDTVSHASKGLMADCKIMKIPDVLPAGEEWAAYLNVYLASMYIRSWGFEDGLGCFAYTARSQDSNGNYEKAYRPNTSRTYVRLDSTFLSVLEYFEAGQNSNEDKYSRIFDDLQAMAGIPTTNRAPISHTSAIYRTYFLLAQTLLHEFAHAFSLSYFERPNSEGGPSDDPWFPGDRANEQGFAFENYVFGGVVETSILSIPPMSTAFADGLQSVVAPFGFQTNRQWDVWYENPKNPDPKFVAPAVMDSDRKIGERLPADRLYPVPQAWTQRLFSDELWTDHIHRYGLQAVKVPKLPDWEICVYPDSEIGNHGTGEDRWNTGEEREWTQWWD